jgi:hypothetical protein
MRPDASENSQINSSINDEVRFIRRRFKKPVATGAGSGRICLKIKFTEPQIALVREHPNCNRD